MMAQNAERGQNQASMATNHALACQGKGSGSNPGDVAVAKTEHASSDADMRADLEGLQAEEQRREDTDMKTASLLGYDSWWLSTAASAGGGERAFRKKDMLNEREQDRHFVVLMAYDFKAMTERKSKLLWEAHISISEHSNQFDKRLASKVIEASGFFGTKSNGLHHTELPEGKVELGPLKNLGTVTGN
jgi:hypothetical protein